MDGNANGMGVIVRKETLVGASRRNREEYSVLEDKYKKKKVLFCEPVSWCSYPSQDEIPKG